MYAPAPPRAKKTNITRSRGGCQDCRKRRRKCDKVKPECGHCVKMGIECRQYEKPIAFKQVTFDEQPAMLAPPSAINENRTSDMRESEAVPVDSSDTVWPVDAIESSESTGLEVTPRRQVFPEALPSLTYNFDNSEGTSCEPWNTEKGDESQSLSLFRVSDDPMETIIGERVEELPFEVSADLSTSNNTGICGLHPVVGWNHWVETDSSDLKLPRSLGVSWGSGHQETFYMNVWDTQCLLALHPAFRQFGLLENNHPIVQKAILSVSACHMSRMLPQRKAMTLSDIPGLAFRPQFEHQNASQGYYQEASQQLRKWAAKRDLSELNAMLAAMILFCSLESSMGNFSGFNIHFNGVNALLDSVNGLDSRLEGIYGQLQDAWRQTHILNWWRRFHFSTPEFQNTPFSTLLENRKPLCEDAEWSLYHRVDIMTTMCEYLSIVSRATIRGWNSMSKADVRTDDMEKSLAVLDTKISKWNGMGTLSASLFTEFTIGRQEVMLDYQNISPLTFATHGTAMNAAYMTTTHILKHSARWMIHHASGEGECGESQKNVELWVFNLLRIAMAISWESCVRYNTHTIGLSGLLLACTIRSQKLEVGLWVEDWLEERRRSTGLEEGSFPVLQILQIIRIVNRERRLGFDVCAIFNTADDGGGAGKFQSYHSQIIDTVMVYAIRRETGEHVKKEIPV